MSVSLLAWKWTTKELQYTINSIKFVMEIIYHAYCV